MKSSDTLKHPLKLVTAYFCQLRAFGCFSQDAREERIQPVIGDRAGFVHAYCQMLEYVGDIHFSDGEVPLLYNTQLWPDGIEPAGFITSESRLTPSQYCAALSVSWGFQATMHASESSAVPRFLKAALWVARRQNVPAAIRYLFALREQGILLGRDTLLETVEVLLRGYRMVSTDDGLSHLFFDGRVPDRPQDFIQANLAEVDLQGPYTRSAEPVLRTLLSVASEQVERVRSATTYDEWLRSQFVLSSFVDVLVSVVSNHVTTVSPTLRSVLDHYEELRADAGGIVRALRVFSQPLCAAFDLMIPAVLAQVGAARLVNERALVPRALEKQLMDGKRHHDLPNEWARLSPAYAQALCDALLEPHHMLGSTKGSAGDPESIMDRVQRAMALGDTGDHGTAVTMLNELVSEYPWAHPFIYELGVAMDRADRPADALQAFETALLVEPENPMYWQSLSIVLRRLGDLEASRLALGTIAMFRSSSNVADDPRFREFWAEWDARWA